MSTPIRLRTPLTEKDLEKLAIGDKVLITGVIYTGRDAAHKRLFDLLEQGKATASGPYRADYLFCGTFSGKTGSGYRVGRADDKL